VNEYIDGIGIMPHTDGPLYFPHVAILSLGSGAIFNFYKDYL
jgi:alkylated DNA repair protein alkB family protein 6